MNNMLQKNRLVKSFSIMILLLMTFGVESISAQSTLQTLTILGGVGNTGDIAAYTETSRDGGQTWQPAYIYKFHPWGYSPGTNAWINSKPDPYFGGASFTDFRIRFNIPEDFTDPNMTFTLKADNEAALALNGTPLAYIVGQATNAPDLTISQSLQSGLNEITIKVKDVGNLPYQIGNYVGINYRIDITMFSEKEPSLVLPGIIACWSGDQTTDDSAENHNAVANNISYTDGINGYAFKFDGNSTLEVQNAADLSFNALTISTMVKFDALSGSGALSYPHIISKGANDLQGWDWGLYLSGDNYGNGFNSFRFAYKPASFNGSVQPSASSSMQSPFPATTNQWYHVVVTHDGSTMKMYIDGVVVAQKNNVPALGPTNRNVYIGNVLGNARLRGSIDDLQLFNYALTESEIAEITTCGSIIGSPNSDPVAAAGDDQNFDCTPAAGIEVTLDGSGSTDEDGDQLTYSWSNGVNTASQTLTLAPGTHTFTLTVNDGKGGSSSDELTVTINADTEAPVPDIETLADVTGECAAIVTEVPTATDACGGEIIGTTNDPLEYSVQGEYVITWSYTDENGNSVEQTQKVFVQDTDLPTIAASTQQLSLWPPNHKYETVSLSDFGISVSDNCADVSTTSLVITKVTSDEAENAKGKGDGNTEDDIVIANDFQSVDLRKERAGNGNGRVYTIFVALSDGNGNVGEASFQVVVQHNKKSDAIDDGAAYEVEGGSIVLFASVENGDGNSGQTFLAKSVGSENNETSVQTLPENFELSQNYPNPFNPSTTIQVSLPDAGSYRLNVYNLLGQHVASLFNGQLNAGVHSFNFDASNLSTGVYVYFLRGEQINISKKMTLMK